LHRQGLAGEHRERQKAYTFDFEAFPAGVEWEAATLGGQPVVKNVLVRGQGHAFSLTLLTISRSQAYIRRPVLLADCLTGGVV
jgi:hypothetical protein